MNEDEFRKGPKHEMGCTKNDVPPRPFWLDKTKDVRGVRSMLKNAMMDEHLSRSAEEIRQSTEFFANVHENIIIASRRELAELHGVCEATMQLRLDETLP